MELGMTRREYLAFIWAHPEDEIPELDLPAPLVPPGLNTGKLDSLRLYQDILTEARTQDPNFPEGPLDTEDLLNFVQGQMAAARAQDPGNSGISELAVDLVSVVIDSDKRDILSLNQQLAALSQRARFDQYNIARLTQYENIAKRQIVSLKASLRALKKDKEDFERKIEDLEHEAKAMEGLSDIIMEEANAKEEESNQKTEKTIEAFTQTLKEGDEKFAARLQAMEKLHREEIEKYRAALASKEAL